MRRILVLVLPLLLLQVAALQKEPATRITESQTGSPTVRISINAAAWIRTIPQTLYGANLTAWDGQSGQDAFFNSLMVASGRNDMRWPGGSWGDAYLWSDMEGPNRAYPWIVSYSETQSLLSRIGGRLQPIVNFPGSWYRVIHGHAAAVDAAVAWVEDQKGRNPTAVYWEIGNEIMGPWEEGWQADVTTGSFYGERFADFYLAMKTVNPTIKIGAVADPIDGPDWWNPGLWTRGMLAAAFAKSVVPDFLIIHTYPGTGRSSEYNPVLLGADIGQIAIDTKSLDRIIAETVGQEYVGKIGYWMTEYRASGIGYDRGDEQSDEASEIYPRERLYCGALFLPQYILEMAKHGWQGSNAFGEFYYTQYNRVPEDASYPAVLQPFPDWYLYPLLTRRFGREMVVAESSEPWVRAYASRDEDGALTVFLANNSPDRDFTARMEISGMTAGSEGQAWIIDPAGSTLTGESGPLQDLNGLAINGVFRPDPLKLDQLPVWVFPSGNSFEVELLRSRMLLLHIPAAVAAPPDETPPSETPAQWRVLPHATGSRSIGMEALAAADPSGVQYSFDCVSGAGHDSGWQEEPFYEDRDVPTGAACTYVLRIRDMSKNRNEAPLSPPASATTLPVVAPIEVENAGFELPGSGRRTNWEDVPGWASDSPASDSGVDQSFSTEGSWNAYLKGSDPSVWNGTGYTVQAGDVIELSFDARDNFDGWTRFRASLFREDDGLRIPIVSRDFTMVRLFRTYMLSFATSDHPDAVGHRVGIEFDTTREGYVSIDRVRLSVRNLGNSLHFAQFGEGLGQLSSQLMLINPDSANPALAQLSFTDDEGRPITVDLNGQSVSGSITASVSPGGLRSLRTDGLGPLVSGAVRVLSDRPLAGVILFGGPGGVAGVGSSTSLANGFIAPAENDRPRSIATGVALMNLTDRQNAIRFELLSSDGVAVAETSLSLEPNGHKALFLDEIFGEAGVDLGEFEGLLKAISSAPLAATVLRTSPGELATFPVEALPPTTTPGGAPPCPTVDTSFLSAPFSLLFAHFGALQGQLFSRIILVNPGTPASASAILSFRDDRGEAINLDLDGETIIGSLEDSIPAGGVRFYEPKGDGKNLATGSVAVTSDRPLAGLILFGGAVGVAGVGSSPEIKFGFMGPVEESAADGIRTGLAVMSLEEGTVTVDLELLTPEAETLGTTTLTLPGRGHVARFIDELVWPSKPDLSQMEGILRATASGRVAALILQSRVGQFATLPVVPLEGP